MSDVSESLISLTKNERMSELLIFLVNRSFAHFLTKNERFARKSNERISSPAYDIIAVNCKQYLTELKWQGHEIFRILFLSWIQPT